MVSDIVCWVGVVVNDIVLNESLILPRISLTSWHDSWYEEELVERFHLSDEEENSLGEIQLMCLEL